MSKQIDYIKKVRVRYLKCTKGQLHEGQILNFICIDSNCKNKGLICPVCQNTTHEGHQTLHLKLFLNEINKNLYAQEGQNNELGGLAEYLRSLDNSKRQMVKVLRDLVEQMATKVKQVEGKIQSSYFTLRKIILSQSTVSMKLPELYRLLTEQDCLQDQAQVHKQINKYSELLEYKDNKLTTVDSAKTLIDQYANKASVLSLHFTTLLQETTKIFNGLPLKISKFGTNEKEKAVTGEIPIYSSVQKSWGVNLQNEKKIQLAEQCYGGIIFTKDKSLQSTKKISFKIVASPQSGAITFGVANPQKYKDKNYEIDYQGEPGVYGMCSFGFFTEQTEGTPFVYGVGDTIDVTWNPIEKKLKFARRHGIEQGEMSLSGVDDNEAKKLIFYTMLTGPGDIVEIVE